MTVTWTDAIVFAFAWSCIWGSLLVSHVLDWKFEWMQPKLWFLYVKRKLAHSKEIFFKNSELPNKICKPLEELMNVFETGNLQSPDLRMDQSFRRKFEHELHLLKKNNIRREMRMAYLKLPEEYTKKNDFKHWSDAGREWREVVLQGSILNRYLDRKNNRILYEDFFAHGAVLLRQSRHIRHNEVGSKNRNDEQIFYSQYTNVICPSCGATVTLTSDEDHCPYCGGYIKSDFFDWQTEEFLIYRDYNPNTRNFKLTAATMIAFFIPAIPCFRFILPHSYFLALGSAFVITALLALLLWLRILRKTDNIEDLKKQIVRYDEKVLHSDLNEALYEKTVSSELLYYSVDQLQLQAVENTDTRTQITLHAILHQLILSPNHQISASNQPVDLKLYRARYPQRMKSKGQAVYAEKECPRCGANFVPDQDGCCSYCGYRLPIDNSKWRILEQ